MGMFLVCRHLVKKELDKPDILTRLWLNTLSPRISKSRGIYHLGKILVETKFHDNQSKRCSVWTKTADRPNERHFYPQSLKKNYKCELKQRHTVLNIWNMFI